MSLEQIQDCKKLILEVAGVIILVIACIKVLLVEVEGIKKIWGWLTK